MPRQGILLWVGSTSAAASTLTLTWTASDSSDIDHYAIRRSATVNTAVVLDGTPHDTDASSPWTEDVTGVTGRLEYLLRAVDAAGNEEANLSEMVYVDLEDGVQVLRPNSPSIAIAEAIADGEVRVQAMYDRTGEAGVATSIHMFVNDGAGGAMDWNTSKGNVSLPTGPTLHIVELDSSGLTGALTYDVGIRAKTTAGVYDANTTTVEVTTDSTAPDGPTLALEVV